MPLSNQDKKHFKAIGHHLKAVVQSGDHGVTDAFCNEVDARLEDHELIKIKITGHERNERNSAIAALCKRLDAELIQRIGNVALLYRAAAQPDPKLSNLLRYANA